ncbi:site-specific integrase [Lentzea sp. NPDC051213]|uniref:site-specific integrase n=1 Tax=Lentzea sp. NPDC051213 TaxID=3364126 RepID=UPI0037B828C1
MSLPEPVQHALARVSHSVLIDLEALARVRERFDDEQAASLTSYLRNAQSPNTVRAYRSDWIAWAGWCQAERRQALPADPLDVAVYLAAAADTRKPDGSPAFGASTLERKSAAISAVHAANGVPSPTRSDVVRLTLRGIRRSRKSQPHRKRPVLLDTLEALLHERPEEGPARARDAVLLLVGFAGALRRSELAGIEFEDVTVDVDPRTHEPLLLIRLGTTKTDQTGKHQQTVVLPRGSRRPTCPVCAFADWSDVLDGTPVSETGLHRCHGYQKTRHAGAVFPVINRHGGIGGKAMSGRAVAELVKRYAVRAGLDPALFGGHSLRAGFATQAALGGASDREIMRQGRWTNPRTVHRYIRTANPLEDNAVTRLGL